MRLFFVNRRLQDFKNSIVFITLLMILIICISCEDNTINPESILGNRNYIWSEDTINVPLNKEIVYQDMLGNTPNDIWIGNLVPGLWHYDGLKWREFPFPDITPSALWLFEDNTLWIGTRQNRILKIEDHIWTEDHILTFKDYDKIEIFRMYGATKNNIFAVGRSVKFIVLGKEHITQGIISHYNGEEWKVLSFPVLNEISLHRVEYQSNINTYFIFGTKIVDGVVIDKLFTFDGQELREILSTSGSITLSSMNGIVYINHNSKIFKYSNKKLVLWKDFSGSEFVSNFKGRGENDFFNVSERGIGHFNGEDYKTIYPTHLEINSMLIFEKDIFFGSKDSDNKKHIIIHGRFME